MDEKVKIQHPKKPLLLKGTLTEVVMSQHKAKLNSRNQQKIQPEAAPFVQLQQLESTETGNFLQPPTLSDKSKYASLGEGRPSVSKENMMLGDGTEDQPQHRFTVGGRDKNEILQDVAKMLQQDSFRSSSSSSESSSGLSNRSWKQEDKDKLQVVVKNFQGFIDAQNDQRTLQALNTDNWIDPTPNLIEGIFQINQTNIFVRCCAKKKNKDDQKEKVVVYDYRSLYFLHFENKFREELVNFTCSSMFENIIILLILMNTIVLALYDYKDRENFTEWNQRLETVGHVFTILFTIEMILKILSQGFVVHRNAYLRDAWNSLDLIVVFTGIMELLDISLFKVRALRTLRVLRPLRSIKAFPKMRQLVSSLVGSLSSLLNAVVFMLFIFMLFGILGIQQFQGTMYRRCRFTEFPNEDGTWPFDPEVNHLCSPNQQGTGICPENRYCKEPADANLSSDIDDPKNDKLIMYNIISFDNLLWAMVSIFQMISLEGWTTVMYNLMDSNIAWMAVIFSVTLIIIGSFFLLNVILAVLADALNMVETMKERQDQARITAIVHSKMRAETQKKKKEVLEKIGSLRRKGQSDLSQSIHSLKSSINSSPLEFQQQQSSKKQPIGLQPPISASKSQQSNEEIPKGLSLPKSASESQKSNKEILKQTSIEEVEKVPNLAADKAEKNKNLISQENQNQFFDIDQKVEKEKEQTENVKDQTPQQPEQVELDLNKPLKIKQIERSRTKIVEDEFVLRRAGSNCLYNTCFKLCTHWSFTLVITAVIVANTVVMASEKYPEDPEQTKINQLLNDVFTWIFVLEMVIKLIGLGFHNYAKDRFNIFDAIVVAVSLIDFVVTSSTDGGQNTDNSFSAFRGVRLLRIFKLARSWSSFREILSKIHLTMIDVSVFSLLLLMFMLIFTLLGMELFGHKVRFENDKPVDPDLGIGLSPRPNFDNIGMGITTIFAVAIGDDWNYLMAMAWRAEGYLAIAFYSVVYIVMNLILLNLFLAILLQNFQVTIDKEEEDVDLDEETYEGPLVKVERCCSNFSKGCRIKFPCFFIEESESDDGLEEDSQLSEQGQHSEERNDAVRAYSLQVDPLDQDDQQRNIIPVQNQQSSDSFKSDSDYKEQENQEEQKSVHSSNQFPVISEAGQSEEVSQSSLSSQEKEVNHDLKLQQMLNQPSLKKLQTQSQQKKMMLDVISAMGYRSHPPVKSGQINLMSEDEPSPSSKKRTIEAGVDANQSLGDQENNIVDPLFGNIHSQTQDEVQQIPSLMRSTKVSQKSSLSSLAKVPQVLHKGYSEPPSKTTNNKIGQRPIRRSLTQASKLRKISVRTLQSFIPDEYRPSKFMKEYKKDDIKNKTYKSSGTTRKQEFEEQILMLAYTQKNMSLAKLKRMELLEKFNIKNLDVKIIGRSLFCFSSDNWLRRGCESFVKYRHYDNMILVLIAISTILLTLDNPNIDPQGELVFVLTIFDIVLTTLFTLECFINIILFGLVCNGRNSYARNPWNIMDMVIVFFSIFTLVLQAQVSTDLSILKIFRILRVLRPLRLLKRNLGMKIQVISLMKSIPGIINLALISVLILMIFGIQAVSLLKGRMYFCETKNVPDYVIDFIQTKWDCLDYGGEWLNYQSNFDNVIAAMTTMFGMMTTEGWIDIMFYAIDARQINQVPVRDSNPALIVFFSVFMIIGSLFMLNLFVGVVIYTFNIEKEKLSNNNQMTELQQEYVEVLIKCYKQTPTNTFIQTGNKIRDICLKIAKHKGFEVFIFICICANTVILSLSWYEMDEGIIYVLEIFNKIFIGIYSAEMLIKMNAYRKLYFKDNWCVFDFLIVISAWMGIFLLQVFNINLVSISTIIRSFRIARILKLIKSAKNLQLIFQTFINAIPELANVGSLLVLFLFLFSVLGVFLFAEIKLQDDLNRNANFENFGRAILTLFRVATGENWVRLMEDAARQPSITFSCTSSQTYESKVENGIQGCGSNVAYFYFLSFILMVSLVFLNLFIAIILEGFAASTTEQKVRISDNSFEVFAKHWSKYDPSGTGLIDVDKLVELIMDLVVSELDSKTNYSKVKFSLLRYKAVVLFTKWKRNIITDEDRKGFFKEFDSNQRRKIYLRRHMRKLITSMQIPLYKQMTKIQFQDTLNSVIRYAYVQMHKKQVIDRRKYIENKVSHGEKLTGMQAIVQGSAHFWQLKPRQLEVFEELNNQDFQKVINRLENKGLSKNKQITKLNYMRNLRVLAGKKLKRDLDMYEDDIYDSSHYIGIRVIKHYLKRQVRERKINEGLSVSDESIRNSTDILNLQTKGKIEEPQIIVIRQSGSSASVSNIQDTKQYYSAPNSNQYIKTLSEAFDKSDESDKSMQHTKIQATDMTGLRDDSPIGLLRETNDYHLQVNYPKLPLSVLPNLSTSYNMIEMSLNSKSDIRKGADLLNQQEKNEYLTNESLVKNFPQIDFKQISEKLDKENGLQTEKESIISKKYHSKQVMKSSRQEPFSPKPDLTHKEFLSQIEISSDRESKQYQTELLRDDFTTNGNDGMLKVHPEEQVLQTTQDLECKEQETLDILEKSVFGDAAMQPPQLKFQVGLEKITNGQSHKQQQDANSLLFLNDNDKHKQFNEQSQEFEANDKESESNSDHYQLHSASIDMKTNIKNVQLNFKKNQSQLQSQPQNDQLMSLASSCHGIEKQYSETLPPQQVNRQGQKKLLQVIQNLNIQTASNLKVRESLQFDNEDLWRKQEVLMVQPKDHKRKIFLKSKMHQITAAPGGKMTTMQHKIINQDRKLRAKDILTQRITKNSFDSYHIQDRYSNKDIISSNAGQPTPIAITVFNNLQQKSKSKNQTKRAESSNLKTDQMWFSGTQEDEQISNGSEFSYQKNAQFDRRAKTPIQQMYINQSIGGIRRKLTGEIPHYSNEQSINYDQTFGNPSSIRNNGVLQDNRPKTLSNWHGREAESIAMKEKGVQPQSKSVQQLVVKNNARQNSQTLGNSKKYFDARQTSQPTVSNLVNRNGNWSMNALTQIDYRESKIMLQPQPFLNDISLKSELATNYLQQRQQQHRQKDNVRILKKYTAKNSNLDLIEAVQQVQAPLFFAGQIDQTEKTPPKTGKSKRRSLTGKSKNKNNLSGRKKKTATTSYNIPV